MQSVGTARHQRHGWLNRESLSVEGTKIPKTETTLPYSVEYSAHKNIILELDWKTEMEMGKLGRYLRNVLINLT